jgi:uncharacterized membrane protein
MKKQPTGKSLLDKLFILGIVVKGLDGLAELAAGLALLVSPTLVHEVLSGIVGKTSGSHGHTMLFISQYIARLDKDLAASGLTFLIIFLLSHGVIKIILVYCLLKKITRAYPAAVAVLGVFLIYQVYVFILSPTIGMAFLCLLDAAIIGLVWREYRVLLSEKVI